MRISMIGTSGSGKSTVGRLAAERLGVPFVELDSIRHQANWVELPDPQFRARVTELVAGDAWVVDGNYGVVRDIVRQRATHVVWLDLPRRTVMRQVTWRSVARAVLRKELWNGNRERLRDWVQPWHPIRWAWSTHPRRVAEYEADVDERWIRLRTRKEANRWLASLGGPPVS